MKHFATQSNLDVLALVHSHPSGESNLSADDRSQISFSRIPWVVITFPLKEEELPDISAYAPITAKAVPTVIV
jgi:proteasome lid subunit RPN8/RPN11